MDKLTLYFAPDTCARVPLIALEEIGCDYDLETIAFMRGQHRSEPYLALNPKGKVPTLVVGDRALSENVAILTWLHATHPDAKLLPAFEDEFTRATILSDLSFCASGLHPIVTRLRFPHFFCDIPEATGRVYDMATSAMSLNFDLIERRLEKGPWWYGEQWSVLDAYINWVWFRVTGAGFDPSLYPNFAGHNEDMMERPSVERALAISQSIADRLAEQGLAVRFEQPRTARDALA